MKIVVVINDVIEKNKIKSHLNRAKRKFSDLEFELVKEFDDNRQAVNFLYQNSDIDLLIIENSIGEIFSGLDLITLAEKEFPNTGVILLTEPGEEINLQQCRINNLISIIKKRENYKVFKDNFLLALLKQQKKNEELGKEQEKLNDYRTIIDHTHDAIFLIEVDSDNNFYYKRINGTHQRLTALSNEEVKGKQTHEIFQEDVAQELEANYCRCLRKKRRINYTETIKFPAGKKMWQTTLYPVVKNGRVTEIVGASYDITDMEAKQQKLDYIKRHDRFTGLYNKQYFNQLFTELNKKQEDNLALILLNVENFHLVNKIFSYQKGNQIIKAIASILAQISDNNKIAAHLCADHFAVILKNQSSSEIEATLNLIKKEVAQIKVNEVQMDVTAVSLEKINEKISAHDFFNDGVSKVNLKKYKTSRESNFYTSLMNSVRRNSYKELRARNKLLEITRKAAAFFELNNKEREKLLLLAKHHDLGKLALDRNILKKGGRLTAEEWHEYQKHVLITANFVSYYHDLAGITNLALAQYEHFDGSGWPEALKAEEIPYLSRLFAVINFYSKLNSNLYYPFSKDKYYFGALEVREIIKELINYRSKVFDPQIVDEFIEFLEKAV